MQNPRYPKTTIQRRASAFTLMELLIVVGIIVVLISILVPVVGKSRRQARTIQCLANLKSLQHALYTFTNEQHHSLVYTPLNQTNANAATNVRSATWEGSLRSLYGKDDRYRVCPEASEPAEFPVGTAARAHGSLKPPTNAMKAIDDAWSYGSYGINGFLYANQGGSTHVAYAAGLGASDYFISDIVTLDGGVVPANVIAKVGGRANLPPSFDGPANIPAFGDCNDLDAWPDSNIAGKYDPIPSLGGYTSSTGDQKGAKGDSLGRFCLDRHPNGCNIIFLDGHAATVPLADLWTLRWHKSFVPIRGLIVK